VVFVEGLTGDLYIDRKEDIETYNMTFRVLEELAASPISTREIVETVLRSYRKPYR
jgi:hypothetical protein